MKNFQKGFLSFLIAAIAVFLITDIVTAQAVTNHIGHLVLGTTLAIGPIAGMSVEQIRAYANKNLSNYEGEKKDNYEDYEDNFEDFDDGSNATLSYVGGNDDFLDFGGPNRSFATEHNTDLQFTITIIRGATQGFINFFPGIGYDNSRTANGFLTNTGGTDTAGVAVTSAFGSPSRITDFYDFCRKNPTRLLGLKVASDSNSQLSQNITYSEFSPFKQLATQNINLSTIADQNTFNQNVGKIKTPGVILGDQSQLGMLVIASSTLTIVFYCGAVMNQAAALAKKHARAARTIAHVGIDTVRNFHAVGGNNRPRITVPNQRRIG